MPFGGLFKALTGQTDARAQAAQMNTKAGTAAIGGQMRRAQQGAVGQQYSLAASARGGSSPLALREAQRRGQMASQDIAGQGGILQKQLEQSAAQQNAMNQQQTNMMNTNIQAQNDRAFGQFVQGAVKAGAGAMMLSDARAKHAAFLDGAEAGARAVTDPSTRHEVARVPATMITGMQTMNPAAAYAIGKVGRETAPPRLMRRGLAPDVPSGQDLVQSDADAARYGEEWNRRNSAAMLEDLRAYGADKRATEAAQRGLASAEADRGDYMAVGAAELDKRPQAVSDERAKMYSDKELKFPDGVKPAEFSYKPGVEGMPGAPPGEHVGVLAQDLEKSPEGATVVEEDPETGMKMVDTQQLTMLLTAKLAEMDAKLDKLAGGKKKKAKSDG